MNRICALISMHCAQKCIKLLRCLWQRQKWRHFRLSEWPLTFWKCVLLNLIQSQGASKQKFFSFRSYIKITERGGQICPPFLGTNRVNDCNYGLICLTASSFLAGYIIASAIHNFSEFFAFLLAWLFCTVKKIHVKFVCCFVFLVI